VPVQRGAHGRRLGHVDTALPGPGVQICGAALPEVAGRTGAVDLVELGDQFQLDRGDAGDLGGQFGGHRGRHRQHRRGTDARADGRRRVRRARHQFVGELLGAEARELSPKRLKVPYGDPRGDVDDPVGEVRQTGPGPAAALTDAFLGLVPDDRHPSFGDGGGCGNVRRHREVSPVNRRFERG